jgi:hypothetical protein
MCFVGNEKGRGMATTNGRCGTNAGYSHGCRCDACKAAASVVRQRHRGSTVKLPVDPLIRLLTPQEVRSCQGTLERYKETGMTPYQADRLCCKFGWHPWMVFGDLWFADLWLKMEVAK